MPRSLATKVKCQPEDFRVEEVTDFSAEGGTFATYRLTKRCMGTQEAARVVARAWKLPRSAISFGGLKDFQAITRQHLTIAGGPRRGFRADRFALEYLGQAERPFTSKDIRENQFDVVLRNLSKEEAAALPSRMTGVAQGVPNYFDDQRFGCVGASRKFMARRWCLGDYEQAAWLALVDANEHDSARDRREKDALRRLWGAWSKCLPEIASRPRRRVVAFLVEHPADFREALAKLPRDERRLHVSAFQSHLWNRLLTTFVAQSCRAERLISVPHEMGPLLSFRDLTVEEYGALQHTMLPLPTARGEVNDDSLRALLDQVLAGEGLDRKKLHIDHPRGTFFSRGTRAAVVRPVFHAGEHVPSEGHEDRADELHLGRRRVRLRFSLPRGAYGTLVLKHLL